MATKAIKARLVIEAEIGELDVEELVRVVDELRGWCTITKAEIKIPAETTIDLR